MTVIRRPAVRADLEAIGVKRIPTRMRATTLERDGKVLAVLGMALDLEDGLTVAFVDLGDEPARTFGKSLHQAALFMFDEARRIGIKRVIARAQPGVEAAERWIKRFGFEPVEIDGDPLWLKRL